MILCLHEEDSGIRETVVWQKDTISQENFGFAQEVACRDYDLWE